MTGNFALIVDQTGATLEKGTHNTVVLIHADGRRERIGLRALGSVVLHGNIVLSTGLLQALSAHGVAITILPSRGYAPLAGFSQLPDRHAILRHQQHLVYANDLHRLDLARKVVQAKLDSMMEFARCYTANGDTGYYQAASAVYAASNIASLMGIEGAATLKHFNIVSTLYEQGPFHFDKRTRQPPQDAVNAMMSLAYTLAQSQAAQLVLHAGLDVQIGFLHGIHRDRPSLALDLIEPARAPLDGWIRSLLGSNGPIKPEMFSKREDGSVWMTREGRSIFYPVWYQEGFRVARTPIRKLLAGMLAVLRHTRSADGSDRD